MLITLFYISLAIQIFYWGFVTRLFFTSKTRDVKALQLPSVSVVVCARNEYNNLTKLIPYLLKQKYNEYEIIIVDDKSTDQTQDLITKYSDQISFITINETPQNYDSKKYALTKGIEKAKNEFILVTDADCFPESELWIQTMFENSNKQTEVVVGTSFYTDNSSILNSFIQYETALTAFNYIGLGKLGFPYMGVGRNLAYKREIFLDSSFGKFQNHLGGDDDLLFQNSFSKRKIEFVTKKNSVIHTYPKTTIKSYLSQKTRHLSTGKHYNIHILMLLTSLTVSHIACYFSIVWFVDSIREQYSIYLLFALRCLLILFIFDKLKRYLSLNFGLLKIILADFIFIPYIMYVSLFSMFKAPSEWKK